MKNESLYENEKFFDEQNIDNELDLIELFKGLLRNKYIILPIFLLYSGFGLFESIKKKDIWQGQFQIVVSDSKKRTSDLFDPRIQSLVGGTSSKNDLQTQIGILKSPSVLMPIFNKVKDNKIKFMSKLGLL